MTRRSRRSRHNRHSPKRGTPLSTRTDLACVRKPWLDHRSQAEAPGEAALAYAERGWLVLPLHGIHDGRCACGEDCTHPGKHPMGPLVAHGVRDATNDQSLIRDWWRQIPNANVGIQTGCESGLVVMDVDPRNGGNESLKELIATHGPLPHTIEAVTGGGGRHLYFTHPGGLIRSRAHALGKGLDVKGDGGYVVAPPSRHQSGQPYQWKPHCDPSTAPLAPLPGWVLTLLGEETNPHTQQPAKGHGMVCEGHRNETLYRLARSLHAKGASPETLEAALLTANRMRCQPPLEESEVRTIAAHAATQEHRADFTSLSPANAAESHPAMLDQAMIGVARRFVDLYSEYLEVPRSFFYFTFLVYFGALVAKKITMASALRPEPRFYVVLIGESATTRKSTALRIVHEFFSELGQEVSVLFGVGSAEGIAKELEESDDPALILQFDELKSFVDKAKNEHSIALPMVCSLFEIGDFDNRTKHGRIEVRGASLCLVAACTKETFEAMFTKHFHAIGFLNRLWLVVDRSQARIALPRLVPPEEVKAIQRHVGQLLGDIESRYIANGRNPVAYELNPDARELFEGWYARRKDTPFSQRLDTYGHRLMVVLAATTGKSVIDREIVQAVIALLDYQYEVRRECDPVDAENTIAVLEEKIRRVLSKGPLKPSELKRRCNYHRYGLWAFDKALGNLQRAGEIDYDQKSGAWGCITNCIRPENDQKP